MDTLEDAKAAAAGQGKNVEGGTLLQYTTQEQADLWLTRLEDDGYMVDSAEMAPRTIVVW